MQPRVGLPSGLGLDVIALAAPQAFPGVPIWLWQVLFLIGLFLILWSIGQWAVVSFHWDAFFSPSTRLPIKELYILAQKSGWDFSPKSIELLDLCEGIRQAAADGIIPTWGRQDKNKVFPEMSRQLPLIAIPKEHWIDYELDPLSVEYSKENFNVIILNPYTRTTSHRDIHVGARAAKLWLRRGANQFKGLNAARDRSK
ncbi:hypothetical protein V6B08_21195 [Ferrovibrio sp. MS7]|uniref:hypothetical protein n=1 Tax=Ferrovibrio plantarum TaxID=3119164 RepID=UPI003137181D